jgi:transcriptional regulator with XRE-family HTH domain
VTETDQKRPSDVFGTRLREIRRDRDLTQQELAEALEVAGRPMNKAAIVRIERGERGVSLDEALALAYVLNVAPATMLSPPEGEHVWLTGTFAVEGWELRNWLLFGDPTLWTSEGQRVRARMDLVFTIEGFAQAIVDAKRGGDTAGSQAAALALRDAINDHQQKLEAIAREEQS